MADQSRSPSISAEIDYIEYEEAEFIDYWILRQADGTILRGRGDTLPEIQPGDKLWYTTQREKIATGIAFK